MTFPSPTSALPPVGGVVPASKTDLDVMRCLVCDIRNRSLCNSMDEEGLAALAHSSRQLILPPSTTIIEEGEPALAFFNVTRGTVKLFKSLPDGRRQITGFADAGQFLGLSTAQTYSFGAETVDNVRLCRFMRPQLETLLSDYPTFERSLLAAVTDKLAEAQEQMLLLGRKTAREKVATFLLDRMKAFHLTANRLQEAETLASVPMTRVDIADYLGLTIETVSRTISAFRRDHLIASAENHRIRILSVATLANIASGQKAE
ncbi:Crp/Fnr family transcriptional regulator [Acetobacter syzygii]|uniref:Crp/Fnr family transcriptional regulator n=1 Tax=Acetobacter syzygii TaxID=146476 RepID=UPI0039E8FA96